MKIEQFKQGDLITRIKRTTPKISNFTSSIFDIGNVGDGSYIGEKLELVGHDEATIMCVNLDDLPMGEIDLSKWQFDDDGWGYYPHPLYKKAQERIKELLEKKSP